MMKATSTSSGKLWQSFAFVSVVAAHPSVTPSSSYAAFTITSKPTIRHHPGAPSAAQWVGRTTVLPSVLQQQRFMMTSSSSSENGNNNGKDGLFMARPSTPQIQHVNRRQMEEIVEDFHEGGRFESGYCVIDVRTDPEVMMTGKLADSIPTLPVQVILQSNVFALDPDDFEEICGFAKPDPDETLVFTCAAGIRSVYACQAAAAAGYSKLVNYVGGANEWFGPDSQFR